MRSLVAFLVLAASALGLAPAASASDEAVSGVFEMTTAPGILPAWASDDITIVGINPGTVTTSRFASDATISLPVIAQAQTAHATAGGFRIVNTITGKSVRCLIPAIDTRARVIDCLTSSGYNSALFSIESIDTRQSMTTSRTRTITYAGMDIRLTRAGALTLNRELSSTAFSSSVRVADGELVVVTPLQRSERR